MTPWTKEHGGLVKPYNNRIHFGFFMWRNLNVRFQQELALLRSHGNSWALPRVQTQTIDKLYERFESIDDECNYEVNQAIRRWAASGMANWPRLSDKARAMLQVRFETAEQLLHLLILKQGEVLEEMASGREWNTTAAARRILIHWWKERGREMGSDIWVFQQWTLCQKAPRSIPAPPRLPVQHHEPLAFASVA